MSSLRTISRPHAVFSSLVVASTCQASRKISSFKNPNFRRRTVSSPSVAVESVFGWRKDEQLLARMNQRKTLVRASKWSEENTPYETLELDNGADDDQIKAAYRRLAKFYHPDVYDGRGTLEEGETAETRFIKIQAAYELLMDGEKRRQYDIDNRENPMKASQAWMEWLLKKRKAFDQRGDMAISAWAEQQQLQMNMRVRRLSKTKVDPEEERRILAREKKATQEYFSSTLKRHTLVLKKRDLNRKKAEEQKQNVIRQLLAAEGLELDTDSDESS